MWFVEWTVARQSADRDGQVRGRNTGGRIEREKRLKRKKQNSKSSSEGRNRTGRLQRPRPHALVDHRAHGLVVLDRLMCSARHTSKQAMAIRRPR
jgi:hypothetical protein